MSPNLAELLAQIQAGNESALLTLHEQYANLVYSIACRVLNDPLSAEEVTQDTFMRLWYKAETYDAAKGSFVTWLLTITRRLAIDVHRKYQHDPMQDPVYMDSDIERWENILGSGEDADLKGTLVAVLHELPDEQRQVIELAYFHGMSHGQIADYLSQPVGTIKTRIRLGMQKLREAWLVGSSNDPNQDK
ncbi:MAG: sigma-70 family RNA polymerase sigma factor [Chloroflexi bacterium]|nr:sigma-70 family RNA polymerase sigma factor [Chloroflexota bacterium]